jgi:hypothetical protein
MSRDGWRPQIESALTIDLATPVVAQAIAPNVRRGGSWRWSRDGEEFASVGFSVTTGDYTGTLTLNYSVADRDTDERRNVTCVIRLSTTPMGFGGLRWWMHCPYTQRRARKLYKFGPIEQFCHRTAVRPLPTYASQRVSGVARVQAQRWAIRRKLGDEETGLFDEPEKPKWMRWHTFERYAKRDAELSEREDRYISPFLYRLLLKSGKLDN